MINPILKKSISVFASLAIFLVGFYGNFLPLNKSSLFINAQRNLSGARTLADFEKTMSVPLDAPSPIGQEELVRSTATTILATIQQVSQNADLTKELVDYIDGYYQPIVKRGRGMSFEQNLFIIGLIDEAAFLKTKNSQYLFQAQQYFEQGRQLGPNRPQFLYGLFDIYRAENNVEKVMEVSSKILSQWPTDQKIINLLGQFTNSTSTP